MAKQDELFLQEHGRKNYWGYSTLSYFAPEPSYATKAAQEKGAAAVAAVKAGTPYIATGSDPLEYISNNLVTDLTYTTLGMEALHTVTYPTDSLITASYAADGDYVLYTYSCGVLTSVPAGATVLIQAAEQDSFIAGCCLNENGTPIDGFVEAIALERRMLSPLRERAAHIIDTSGLTARGLRAKLLQLFARGPAERSMEVRVTSFGFKHGIPMEADLVFDVRFLPNPYYVAELRPRTGLDDGVRDYALSAPQSQEFLRRLMDFVAYLLPRYVEELSLIHI